MRMLAAEFLNLRGHKLCRVLHPRVTAAGRKLEIGRVFRPNAVARQWRFIGFLPAETRINRSNFDNFAAASGSEIADSC